MVKLNIPDKIKVGAHWYTIVFDKGFTINRNYSGESNFRTLTITLDNSEVRPKSVIEENFVHEMLHAMLTNAGFYKPSDVSMDITEEELVERLTPILYQVLVDNVLQKEVK